MECWADQSQVRRHENRSRNRASKADQAGSGYNLCIRRTEGAGCDGQLRKGSSRGEQDLWDEDKEVNPHLLAMGV